MCKTLLYEPPTYIMPLLSRRDLIARITDELGLQGKNVTQKAVQDVFEELFSQLGEAMARGDRVMVRGFGTFEVKERKEKLGRNPKYPKEEYVIPACACVKFRVGTELKNKVASSLQVIRERTA